MRAHSHLRTLHCYGSLHCYVCNFKNTSENLKYWGSKPTLTSLCPNASAIKKSEKPFLKVQHLSLPSQLFTAFLSVPLPINFSSFMYANTVHVALASHVGTKTQQGLWSVFPSLLHLLCLWWFGTQWESELPAETFLGNGNETNYPLNTEKITLLNWSTNQ